MLSKEEIKARLCIDVTTPNYPLESFVEWVELRCNQRILQYLEQIQEELYADERTWNEAASRGKVSDEQARLSHWCLYCAQARAYYQAAIHNPHKKHLNFLLQGRNGKSKPSLN